MSNTLFSDKKPGLDESNGIGLTNTRRRLDILYPGSYDLKVDENAAEKRFTVYLKLKVS